MIDPIGEFPLTDNLSPLVRSTMNEYYDDEYYDDEYYDESDDDDLDTEPCPNCGREVYEEAERCPYCGEYIIRSSNPLAGRPTWWIILGILGLLGFILYALQ